MSAKQWVITALLRFYPAPWRREYGPELESMLFARPLSLSVMTDVLWNGLRESNRGAVPSAVFGMVLMMPVLSGMLGGELPNGPGWTAVLELTKITFPAVVVKFLGSNLYFFVLGILGFRTALRPGARLDQCGRAAMKASFIAGIPVLLAGFLLLAGILSPATAGLEHRHLTSLEVIASPLVGLGNAYVWGIFGGVLGPALTSLRRSASI